jgi:hypothetical protein
MHTKFWSENLKGKVHSEDLGGDGRTIRMYLRETGWKGVYWIYLAQEKDQRQALVNTVMNLRVQ